MKLLDKIKDVIWGEPDDFDGTTEEPQQDRPSLALANPTGTGRVIVFRPTDYVDSGKIVDYLCDGYLVLLNLEETDKSSLRRIVDFLSGAAYGRDAQMLRIAEDTYLIVPHAVSLVDGKPVEEEPPFQLDAAFGF